MKLNDEDRAALLPLLQAAADARVAYWDAERELELALEAALCLELSNDEVFDALGHLAFVADGGHAMGEDELTWLVKEVQK